MQGTAKIDPELMIAAQLSVEELDRSTDSGLGYDKENNTWNLIIKYGGDIEHLAMKYNVELDILDDTFAIVTIQEDFISLFSNETEVEYIEKPKGLQFQIGTGLWYACIEPVNDYAAYSLKGDGVLIGIIDSGIDYSHPDFLTEEGKTRILRMWDQSGADNPPKGYHHGREYVEEEINDILQNTDSKTMLPGGDFSGHGTMVAGVAAGNGRASNRGNCGVAPHAKLLIVKLGAADYKGYPIKTIDVMYGIKYMIETARELNMPIAINLSYGSSYGNRDGKGLFETYLNSMALKWKSVIVTGSGNDATKRMHISGNVATNNTVHVSIDGYTTNISLEIWKASSDEFDLEIFNPGGGSTGIVPNLEQVLRYGYRNEFVMVYASPPTPLNTNESIHIQIITTLGYLEEGVWTIYLNPKNILSGDYEIWLHGNGCTITDPVQDNTLTLPGTVQNLITVAAFNHLTGNIANFSGQGREDLEPVKPDITAPGVDIHTTAIGGGYQMASGTSIAAPFVTGACALMMQWGIVNKHDPYLYGNKIKASLYRGSIRDKNMPYPNNVWGYGKLCLQNVMDILMENETEPSLVAMEVSNQPIEKTAQDAATVEQLVCSNDYVDIFAEKKELIYEYAKDNDDLIVGFETAENEVILHIKREAFARIVNELEIIMTSSTPTIFGLLDVYSINSSNIFAVNNHPSLLLKGAGVLIGFIDTGIDYTHPCFRNADGSTRIRAIWDQSILSGNPPKPFLFGTEYSEEEINEALLSDDPFSIVPSQDLDGHGTFMAGVACSNESGQNIGVAPESNILCVKLAPAKKYARESCMLFYDEVPAFQSTDIIMGLRYLTDKARDLNMPIAILIAVGSSQGPHTGLSVVRAADYKNGIAIVSACGNEGSTLHHASGVITNKNDTSEIQLNVADGEKGLEVFIWNSVPDKISIGIVSPSGEVVERIPIHNTLKHDIKLVLFDTEIWINYFLSLGAKGDQMTLIRLKDPEPGIWTLILYGDEIISGRYDAYLPLRNWVKPETYFIDSDSSCTVTVFDNALEIISVGAYNHTNHHMYVDSGKGPTRIGIIRPDLIAPGVNISGPLPNKEYGYKSGTSVAAAHVTGAAALILQWGIVEKNLIQMDTRSIRALLIAGARRRTGIKYPNNQSGYGELDLLNTFAEINLNLSPDLRRAFLEFDDDDDD